MSVELRIESWKARWGTWCRELIPPVRQFARLLALPYCYFGQTNWRLCPRHPLGVMFDHADLFFRFECYPDHYSPCCLWNKPRSRWALYFGSGYNPFARGRLQKRIQPPEYRIIFHDKLVCSQICAGLGLPTPRHVGMFDDAASLQRVLVKAEELGITRLIAKPATGAGGHGIFIIDLIEGIWKPRGRRGLSTEAFNMGRYVVEERIQQYPQFADFNATALSTVRIITFQRTAGGAKVLGAFVRFGVGNSFVDNVSQGGLSAGIDPHTGCLLGVGVDKNGNQFVNHPTSDISFSGFTIPAWGELVQLAIHIQEQFPYYRLLGLDLALTEGGPVVVEINPSPDIVTLEAASGPLLANPEILADFAAENLLYSRIQRRLAAEVQLHNSGE